MMNTSKRRLLLIVFFVFLYSKSNGQSHQYIPLLDTTSVWVVNVIDEFGFIEHGYNYFFTSDTLIGSHLYSRIETTADSNLSLPPIPHFQFLREDTSDKKVFIFDRFAQKEYVLYDFGLQVNDTFISSYLGASRYAGLVVTNIDTLTFAGRKHLRFHVNGGAAPYIEGVGSLAGLLETTVFFEGGYELRCMKKGNPRMAYYTPTGKDCALNHFPFVSVDEMKLEKEQSSIYPLPVTTQTAIYENSNERIERVMVYSATGKKVYSSVGSLSFPLFLDPIIAEQGIYVIQIFNDIGRLNSIRVLK